MLSKIVWRFKKGKNVYFDINSEVLCFRSSYSGIICRTTISTSRATLIHYLYQNSGLTKRKVGFCGFFKNCQALNFEKFWKNLILWYGND